MMWKLYTSLTCLVPQGFVCVERYFCFCCAQQFDFLAKQTLCASFPPYYCVAALFYCLIDEFQKERPFKSVSFKAFPWWKSLQQQTASISVAYHRICCWCHHRSSRYHHVRENPCVLIFVFANRKDRWADSLPKTKTWGVLVLVLVDRKDRPHKLSFLCRPCTERWKTRQARLKPFPVLISSRVWLIIDPSKLSVMTHYILKYLGLICRAYLVHT